MWCRRTGWTGTGARTARPAPGSARDIGGRSATGHGRLAITMTDDWIATRPALTTGETLADTGLAAHYSTHADDVLDVLGRLG